MKLPADFRDLLVEFAAEQVEFVLVGGYAVGFHAKPRATKDLDVLLRGSSANLERAARALARYGAAANIVAAVRSLASDEVAYMGQPPLRVDFLRSIDGVDTDLVFSRAVGTSWDGVGVTVIGLEDLIANKLAVGRKQDLADVEALENVRGEGTR